MAQRRPRRPKKSKTINLELAINTLPACADVRSSSLFCNPVAVTVDDFAIPVSIY